MLSQGIGFPEVIPGLVTQFEQLSKLCRVKAVVKFEKMKERFMKRLMLALAMIGLLAGCASQENAGGTSDQYSTSSGQYNNPDNDNPTKGIAAGLTTNMNQNSTSP